MKYTVNWVEKNIGVTRKTLRIYEEKGLMDKKTFQNPDNKYREYSDEDIYRIWCIKLLQGIGYSLKDIFEMTQNADFNFHASLSEKIIDLERKKTEIEQYIVLAKALKLTGSFIFPKVMGSIRFEDFIKKALEHFNTDQQMVAMQNLVEIFLNKTESELTEADLQQAKVIFDDYTEDSLILNEYYNGLVEDKELGVSHPRVQITANLIYRFYCKNIFPEEMIEGMTPQKFAGYIVQIFTGGDIALIQERNYGKDGCEFIAEAFAHFGGYSSAKDIDDSSKY